MEKFRNPKDVIDNLFLDKQELGKITLIVSITLLLSSIHAYRGFDQAEQELEMVNSNLSKTSELINSDRFEEGMDAVSSIRGYNPSQIFEQVLESFRTTNNTIENTEDALDIIENRKETSQWYSLIGVIGIVAGITLIRI